MLSMKNSWQIDSHRIVAGKSSQAMNVARKTNSPAVFKPILPFHLLAARQETNRRGIWFFTADAFRSRLIRQVNSGIAIPPISAKKRVNGWGTLTVFNFRIYKAIQKYAMQASLPMRRT